MALERWEIDSGHSGIYFSVRHLMIAKVRGHFARWSGAVLVEDGDFRLGSVSVVVDASSIDSGVADRDTHLMSADFLDVINHPEMTFTSTRIEKAANDRLRVAGDLTIRGVRREVILDTHHAGRAKDPWGNERMAVSAQTSIDRKEFGLTWNKVLEAGGMMIGESIDIEIEVEAVKQVAKKIA